MRPRRWSRCTSVPRISPIKRRQPPSRRASITRPGRLNASIATVPNPTAARPASSSSNLRCRFLTASMNADGSGAEDTAPVAGSMTANVGRSWSKAVMTKAPDALRSMRSTPGAARSATSASSATVSSAETEDGTANRSRTASIDNIAPLSAITTISIAATSPRAE